MNERSKIKMGVIGVGHLGQHHARLLSGMEGVDLLAVVDADPKRAESIASKYGCRALASADELLSLGVEAVTVAAPTVFHHSIGMKTLQSGVHTLIEKPITFGLKEAEELLSAAESNRAILQVGHVERFNGAVLAVQREVHSPRFIECHRLSPFPERSLDVGVVLDVMIHDIDIILSFVRSPAVKVDAIGSPVLTEKEDIANVRLEFENGCVANVTASRVSMDTMRKIRVFQPDRYISLDYHKQTFVVIQKKEGVGEIASFKDLERRSPPVEKTEPLKLELEHFVDCVRRGATPTVSGEEGRDALKLALRILEQIKARGGSS